jgi:hypothetical protein
MKILLYLYQPAALICFSYFICASSSGVGTHATTDGLLILFLFLMGMAMAAGNRKAWAYLCYFHLASIFAFMGTGWVAICTFYTARAFSKRGV